MVVLEKKNQVFFIYNYVKDCSALHLEQKVIIFQSTGRLDV